MKPKDIICYIACVITIINGIIFTSISCKEPTIEITTVNPEVTMESIVGTIDTVETVEDVSKPDTYELSYEINGVEYSFNQIILNDDLNESYGKAKTFMDAKSITSKSSKQYKLKQFYTIDDCGFYRYNNYYVIAVGSHYAKVGDIVRVTLTTGQQFEALIGDQKANKDTVEGRYQKHDGSVVEFFVNLKDGNWNENCNRAKKNIKTLFSGGVYNIEIIGEANEKTL